MRTRSCSLYNCIVSNSYVQRHWQNYNQNTAYCSNGLSYTVISRFGKGEIHTHFLATPGVCIHYQRVSWVSSFLFQKLRYRYEKPDTVTNSRSENKAMANFVWAPQLLQTLCKFQRKRLRSVTSLVAKK
jgi:hypothetical protein